MAALTTGLLVASGLAQGYGAIKNAQAQREQADFQAGQDQFNATVAGLQAEDAIARGEQEAKNAAYQAGQIKGAQKAGFAGSGVAVDSGSAADIIAETDKMSMMDILTIKNNAAREAFGYRAQGIGLQAQAEITRKAGRSAANSTLLTGGANLINLGYGYATKSTKEDRATVVNNYYGKGTP